MEAWKGDETLAADNVLGIRVGGEYLDLIFTVLYNPIHHRLLSIYLPSLFHASQSGTLPLPPLTVCAPWSPYPPPTFHRASPPSSSSPQCYSDAGCIPMMRHLLCSRFFRLIVCISLVESVPVSVRVSKGKTVLMGAYIEKLEIENP